jgi:hypothetical protein
VNLKPVKPGEAQCYAQLYVEQSLLISEDAISLKETGDCILQVSFAGNSGGLGKADYIGAFLPQPGSVDDNRANGKRLAYQPCHSHLRAITTLRIYCLPYAPRIFYPSFPSVILQHDTVLTAYSRYTEAKPITPCSDLSVPRGSHSNTYRHRNDILPKGYNS